MFGYVRPLKGEMKVKEYEQFKAVYCGLCHSLRRRCGLAARFVVNFDFTFMTMLLSESKQPCWSYHRCMASPFRKKCCCVKDPALDIAADYSVILAWWKLRDAMTDEGGFKRVGAACSGAMLYRAYRKAASHAPEFDRLTRENLKALSALEQENCPSLDKPADKFAAILQSAAGVSADDSRSRVLSQLFYHTGRIIYLLDAADDLAQDWEKGRYNPLISRFELTAGELPPEAENALRLTLQHSLNLQASAFALLPEGPWTPVLANIIYEGMPWVTELVLRGQWHEQKRLPKIQNTSTDTD